MLLYGFTKMSLFYRLSTITNANQILVLKDGEIIQRGNHQKLLEAGGLYKELWDQQAKVVESASISEETKINNSGDNEGAGEK
jgi:ABC-type cobalamin/Fe3+-siderophores transport system ATPase subunit